MLYNLIIYLLTFGVKTASLFNGRARALVQGRKDLLQKVTTALAGNTAPVIWVHCSSLGEFEQGRPVMERLKREFPSHKLLLTFFSPSGYNVRKNYTGADFVFYIPFDTPSNARKWIEVTNPVLTIFVKYEFWLNFSKQLHARKIPLISISGIFRPSQPFFQSYGKIFRDILNNFDHFFVQNLESVRLLESIGIKRITQAGDTRFDRVHEITSAAEPVEIAAKFKADEKLMVVGSCWPEDLEVLAPFINETSIRFIVAPHEISDEFITHIERMIEKKTIRYSKASGVSLEDYQVLIIDNIGMLSKLYRYGEFAFVGGAFGKGLHNILEAACFGIPVFFGNRNYQKFNEATELIMHGGAFEVNDFADLKEKYEIANTPESFLLACEVTRNYVINNLGATEKIMRYCRQSLKS